MSLGASADLIEVSSSDRGSSWPQVEDLSRVRFMHYKLISIFICVTAGVYLLSNGLGLSCQGVLLLYSVVLLLIRFETNVLLFACTEILVSLVPGSR